MELVAVKYVGEADFRTLRVGDIPGVDQKLVFPQGDPIPVPIEVWEFFSQHPVLNQEFELVLEDDSYQLELPWEGNESVFDDESILGLSGRGKEEPQGA